VQISKKKLKEMYEKMFKIRYFEEKAMELFQAGELLRIYFIKS